MNIWQVKLHELCVLPCCVLTLACMFKRQLPVKTTVEAGMKHPAEVAVGLTANDLKVPIHEWHLPDDESEAHNVVFELQAPPIFCTWWDITYGLLHDICTPKDSWPPAVKTYEQLNTYNPLSLYSTWRNRVHQIGMASGTKSFEASHYGFTTPGVSSHAVC